MPLLNYTTSITASRSIEQATKMLRDFKVSSIVIEYAEGEPVGMTFILDGRAFKMPVRIEEVQQVLKRQRLQPRFLTREHAARVAWRITKDWLEAQLALVSCHMVTLDEVMLPYMRSKSGQTFFELYADGQMPALKA